MRSLSGEREADRERAAGAGRALHYERAVVGGHDRARDGEAEPGATGVAGARGIEPDERLEDPLRIRGIDPRTGVAHTHPRVAIRASQRQLGLAVGGCVLDRVSHEVQEGSLERRGIARLVDLAQAQGKDIVGPALVAGALLTSACASREEWTSWRSHPAHFASRNHFAFSLHNRDGEPPRVTREDLARAGAEDWWGDAVRVGEAQILER